MAWARARRGDRWQGLEAYIFWREARGRGVDGRPDADVEQAQGQRHVDNRRAHAHTFFTARARRREHRKHLHCYACGGRGAAGYVCMWCAELFCAKLSAPRMPLA